MRNVCVLGLGYIGLPTASVLATRGCSVLGVDVSPQVLAAVGSGRAHVAEPDLDVLVRAAVGSGNLRVAPTPAPAEVFIIAVPTPFRDGPGGSRTPDLSFVEAAARSLASVVADGNLVILESTSPVGTTEKVRAWVEEGLAAAGRRVSGLLYAHCPERVLPGQVLRELVTNDRICGGLTPEASSRARDLYAGFCTARIFLTDARTAELAKLAENAYRDVNIAYANELAAVCERVGVDVWELIALANRHPRVNILRPGPGVGGHCVAVDPWFIVDAAPDRTPLIRAARAVNDGRPAAVASRVLEGLAPGAAVACLGLAFKPDVDDLRESPAVAVAARLADAGCRVLAVEPHAPELPEVLRGRAELVTLEDALARADAFALLVDHRAFAGLRLSDLRGRPFTDTRGMVRS